VAFALLVVIAEMEWVPIFKFWRVIIFMHILYLAFLWVDRPKVVPSTKCCRPISCIAFVSNIVLLYSCAMV